MNETVENYNFDQSSFFIKTFTVHSVFITVMGRTTGNRIVVNSIVSPLPGLDLSEIKFEYNDRVWKLPQHMIYQGPKNTSTGWVFGTYVEVIPVTNLEYLEWKYEHPKR